MARLRFFSVAFQREYSTNCESLSAFLWRELFKASFTRGAYVFGFCLPVAWSLCLFLSEPDTFISLYCQKLIVSEEKSLQWSVLGR